LNKNSLFNIAIILAGIGLTVVLGYAGCKSPVKEVETHDHSAHDHEENSTSQNHQEENIDLDQEVELALENIAKGKETEDMSLLMTEGIQKLLAVVRQDSNNVKAIYRLGLFSIESGQLEKAEKRFEKLVLLQPENQEYENTLNDIREQLGN
jgi:tetratricopeptide (TPR) repeat protein